MLLIVPERVGWKTWVGETQSRTQLFGGDAEDVVSRTDGNEVTGSVHRTPNRARHPVGHRLVDGIGHQPIVQPWLHLSGTGFQIHPRAGKLRHYRWCEIDEFMRVESQDEDGGLVAQVGFRFAPQRHRTPRDKIRSALAPSDRDGMKSDGVLDGAWNCPSTMRSIS
jgi:hypothetical protein